MPPEKKSFINVDELMPQVTLEQAANFYGVTLPELKKVGAETRARCFLTCGRTAETGDRALAIQADSPFKTWHCHAYGCGKGGNLVSLCDLMKPGTPAGGRPRGERFKEIARDLLAMAEGRAPVASNVNATTPLAQVRELPRVNLPLARSENERARGLVELDRKFVRDPAAMPPRASAYLRRRSYLTPEAMARFRMGYLPRDTGDDKSGGTMRGKIVYPYLSESGEVLTWFGRDPDFEDKHKAWSGTDKKEREPEKFHFVKGFHRGIELWNQHSLRTEAAAGKLKQLGLILVEGPNDAIRLDTLGVPAVALRSRRCQGGQQIKIRHDANAMLRTVAIRAGAEVIVTYNLSDFPAQTLACYDIEAQHPDDFLVSLLDLTPGVVCAAVKRQRESLRNPPKMAEELLATLEGQGLTQAVARLRQFDEQWLQDLLDIMRDQFANFNEVYKAIKEGRKSTTPKLRKDKKKSFLDFINSPEWYIEQLRALYQRSLHYAEEPYALTPER